MYINKKMYKCAGIDLFLAMWSLFGAELSLKS